MIVTIPLRVKLVSAMYTYSEDLYVKASINPAAYGNVPEPGDEPEPMVVAAVDPDPDPEPKPQIPEEPTIDPEPEAEPIALPPPTPPKVEPELRPVRQTPSWVWALVAVAGVLVVLKLSR